MIEPCHQFDDEWELLVLGTLDDGRSADMRAHAAGGCARCQDRLQAALGLVGSIGASLEPVDPPAYVEARLQQRLRALEAGTAAPRGAAWRSTGPRELIVRLAAVAALVACAVLVWQDLGQRRKLAALRARVERQPAVAPPDASRPAPPQPTAPPPTTAAGSAEAAREWAMERARLAAAVAQADAARARAETDAARWRDELTRLEQRLASAAPVAPSVAPPSADPPPRVDQQREEVGRLAADVRRLEAQARRETGRARAYANALQVALDPGSRRVALKGVDRAAGAATASALLASDGRLVLTTRDLPPLGSDKCYQLWIIRRDNPAVVSGGVLNDVAAGQVVHLARVEGRADLVTGFAITDEPAGGSESSRGRKLLFGAMP
jgi:anti-sigma-K factor RskA